MKVPTPVVLALMAMVGFWLWLYFAALLWDGFGGRWAHKSERARSWLRAVDARPPSLRKAGAFLAGFPYHAIWMRPVYSFGFSVLFLGILAFQLT